MRGGRTMFLFVFRDERPEVPADLAAQKAFLRERFSDSAWECAKILDALQPVDSLYIDRVSQLANPIIYGDTCAVYSLSSHSSPRQDRSSS
jgi:hypothetical protein